MPNTDISIHPFECSADDSKGEKRNYLLELDWVGAPKAQVRELAQKTIRITVQDRIRKNWADFPSGMSIKVAVKNHGKGRTGIDEEAVTEAAIRRNPEKYREMLDRILAATEQPTE